MSTRKLSNTSGTVTDSYVYDAFGNLINRTGLTTNNYLYTGEQYDPNVGFYYLRARYSDPDIGRFISHDPLLGSIFDPVSLHRYLYAQANPVMFRDPTGTYNLAQAAVVSGVIGVLTGMAVYRYTGSISAAIAAGGLITGVSLILAAAVLAPPVAVIAPGAEAGIPAAYFWSWGGAVLSAEEFAEATLRAAPYLRTLFVAVAQKKEGFVGWWARTTLLRPDGRAILVAVEQVACTAVNFVLTAAERDIFTHLCQEVGFHIP
jgi:RHS repeat-associated protein